ncbi:MAG: excinuclease ABC subunit UvrC [Methanoregula sp.]|nr:MAG: excinuclease ABC subunit UvrC [Methanoregula sp.]
MITLPDIPHAPGCYLFSDQSGTIIYIGKAKDLRKRVAGYFSRTDHDTKTRSLVGHTASVDFVVTTSEVEAFILENNLIKKHLPRYNIDLKDAKRFAYIGISRDPFPRIGIARRITKGEGTFFGPFVSAEERDHVLRVIKKVFCLRSCRKLPKRACLRYHMQSCSAPCIGKISREEYLIQVERAATFLKGRSGELLKSLQAEMEERSAAQDFEYALVLRNQIAAIGHLADRQHVERPKETDQDIIAYTVAGETVFLMVFSVEKGLLIGKQEYSFDSRKDFFEEFLVQFYADRTPPAELVVPVGIGIALTEYLSQRKGSRVRVTVPRIGEKKKLLDLVYKNIEHAFLRDGLKVPGLQAALDLKTPPSVIECFDISHLFGTSMTGSMVQFRDGKPDKKNYRRFRIRTVEGIDDFASIAEVVKRRYLRLTGEGGELPDLVIIDGGKGQLGAARDVLVSLGCDIPVIAIAKREEDVYVPGEILPRRLDPKGTALQYLQEIRNEAHRFAIAYHKLLRSKRAAGRDAPRHR